MSSDKVVLRTASSGDEVILQEIYASTRADELAMTNWSEAQQDAFVKMQFAAQQEYYRAQFPQGEHLVILVDDQPVGRLYTAENEDEIRIIDITVLPRHRNAGIGTPLIKDVMMRAQDGGKPVRVYVESYNRSVGLFERLGFAKTKEDGINLLMEWRPSQT